jgi:hypothetical protein
LVRNFPVVVRIMIRKKRKGGVVMAKFIVALSICAVVALALSLVTPAFTQDMGKEATIKGEVVDTACFLFMGKRGEAHKGCAEACAKAGQDLGIYDEASDTVYFLAGEKPGLDPNGSVKDHIAKNVEATGTVVEKAKAHGIAIKSVKEL